MQIAVNGILLNVEGSGEGPAILALHGFTGSTRSLLSFARAWPGFTTMAVDIIGHGLSDSPVDPERYRMDAAIDDLAELIGVLGYERVALLGYSMGGRLALRFALAHPEKLWALVLESASPGIENENEQLARIASDEALAVRLEREGLEPFIDYWQSIPLWASQSRLPQEKLDALRAQRLQNNVTGLANSLRGMGAGADDSVFGRLGELTVPTLVMAGDLDTKYHDLALAMTPVIPNAELCIINDAGHAAHFEQPGAFAQAVARFLSAHVPASN